MCLARIGASHESGEPMVRMIVFLSLALLVLVPSASSREGELIASMDEMRFSAPKEKGSASLVDGKVGKAVRFRFEADAPGTFFTSQIHGRPEWDKADGFSFWVRGEDADGFGGLEFIYDDDFAVRVRPLLPGAGEGMDQGDRGLAGPGSRAPRPAAQTTRIAERQPALEAVRHVRRQVVVLGRLPGVELRPR